MLKDIVEVQPRGEYRLHLRFEDGVEGELDISQLIPFEGVFARLQDPKEFSKVRVNPELGTIEWPNGADLDPDVLYSKITGQEISSSAESAVSELE